MTTVSKVEKFTISIYHCEGHFNLPVHKYKHWNITVR